MATYSSYKELEGNILRLTDEIRFEVKDKLYFYKVFSDHLSCINTAENDGIFTALNISDKNAFAAHIYGYTICRGTEPTAWPEYCFSDLEAATNIVLALFKLCEDYNKKDTKKEPVLSEGKVADSNSESKKGFSCDGFSFTRKDIPKNCPYHPYVIDQALIEFSKGIEPNINTLEKAFSCCIHITIASWFIWEHTTQGHNYWSNIDDNPGFIPDGYIPTYFIEELPVDTEDLVEYCKRDISDTITYCSSRTSYNSIKIPCSYEEVTLSIKKKKVHF